MSDRAGQELSAEARQLIANARDADDPTAEDEARVKARWLAGIAAGAGVSSLSEAVRAAASTGWSWGMKSALLAGAAAVAAVSVYLGWPEAEAPVKSPAPRAGVARPAEPEQRLAEPVPPSEPEIAPLELEPPGGAEAEPPAQPEPLAVAPEVVASPDPPARTEAAPPAPRAASSRPARAAAARVKASSKPPASSHVAAREVAASPTAVSPTAVSPTAAPSAAAPPAAAPAATAPEVAAPEAPPAPSHATGQLGEEIARLSEIRAQLQTGSPNRALELLREYRTRFAEPNLAMEADALQVDALCKAGKREAARDAAAAFTRRWPASPLEQRVTSACQ